MKTNGWCNRTTIGLLAVLMSSGLAQWACSAGSGRCQEVVCRSPPDDTCLDENTSIAYAPEGRCRPATGECVYPSEEIPCPDGCKQGWCIGEKVAWGWITILEQRNVTNLFAPDWTGGLRAFFSTEPHFMRSLSHQVGMFRAELDREGPCVLYDAYMIGEPGGRLPMSWNVGTIHVQGARQPLDLTADDWDRYSAAGAPADLFDDGDPVTVSATGGELEPFSLTATGVAPLELPSTTVRMIAGEPTRIHWQPADPDSRVMVVLMAGYHYPHPYSAAIVCDVADSAGQVEINARLGNVFIQSATFPVEWPRHLTRYTRDLQSPFGKEVELLVGVAEGLTLEIIF